MFATATLVKLDSAPDRVERVYRVLHDAISAGTLAPMARIRDTVWDEHVAIAHAVAVGDAAAAVHLMPAHNGRAAEHTTRQLTAAANPPPLPRHATGD